MSRKLQIWIEVSSVFFLIIYQIWFAGRKSFLAATVALFIVVGSWISRKESFENLGLRPPSMKRLWLVLSLLLLIFSSFAVIFAAYSQKTTEGTMPATIKILGHALRYFGWAFFQQLLLNGYFARRFANVFHGNLSAAIATGVVFSLVHAPNPLLMIVTLFTGMASAYVFLKNYKFAGLYFKNPYLLAILHVAIGVCIAHLLPDTLTLHMKIGPSALKML